MLFKLVLNLPRSPDTDFRISIKRQYDRHTLIYTKIYYIAMDTSNKSGRKDSATGQLRTRADFKFQISLIMPPTVLPFRGTRLKIQYKTEFEAFKRFILLDLWAQFLLNGEDWCSARFTHDYTNDGMWPGGLGFSNESQERKLCEKNMIKKCIIYTTPALPAVGRLSCNP